MKMLDKATSHPRARTWKNIGNTAYLYSMRSSFSFCPSYRHFNGRRIVAITLIYVSIRWLSTDPLP